jgi:hypothetical protein
MRKAVIVSFLFAGLLLLLLIGFPFVGSPTKPKVTVTLLGYTNEVSGRFARFAITNEASFAVIRHVGYALQAPSGEHRWTNSYDGWFTGQGNLGSGDSEVLMVAVPTNQPTWRLSLRVLQDVSFPTLMMRKARAKLQNTRNAGTSQRRDYHNPQYAVSSDWIVE